ncbi:hypothetical protein JZO70_12810 [Enterococcus sp. 669A]|uniref:Uncharacterized protein n=1 Tax=Candidatus Enterococcus moelleringii TaxID=2815325 RepID=A0ABS3LD81_9ENTE|nr:hypothetical protein [Enterococcus sp. 669A]MBO1307050.1 hypothetical protein [Enterococcus sp. 669A]
MTTKPLGQRQLLSMGYENLSKRFSDFFKEKNDAPYIIQCALVVMVKNALCPADFSRFAEKLIRSLFMGNYDLSSVRELCVYFRNYFNDEEWSGVTKRLFPNLAEFDQLEKRTNLHINKIEHLLYSGKREVEMKANLITTFEDENGKKHGWTLSNVDSSLSPQEHEAILAILSTIDIFQKDGVRKFAKLVSAHYSLIQVSIDPQTIKEETPETQQGKFTALPKVTALSEEVEIETSGDDGERHQQQSSDDAKNVLLKDQVSTPIPGVDPPMPQVSRSIQDILPGLPIIKPLKNTVVTPKGELVAAGAASNNPGSSGKKDKKDKTDLWSLLPRKKSRKRDRKKKR